ncbi:MAG TPA: GNAT family N-acetyltransferase [Rubrobacteraceae bacterium]|jgi:GNAT superfamily N-acetyltransferase
MIARDWTEAPRGTRGVFGGGNDHRRVSVREMRPEDAGGLRRMFARCSQETIYLRFHMAWPTVPEWAIGLLVGAGDVDRDGQAIVAVAGTEIVGHAMYVKDRSDDREAEVAVIVEDGRRSSGVGRLLLSEIAGEARRTGVEVLTCTALGDNYRLLEVARRVFPNVRLSFSGGSCYIRLPLGRHGGDLPTVDDTLVMREV